MPSFSSAADSAGRGLDDRGIATTRAGAGMTAIAAAWGVHFVVNENMTQAARMHLLERNVDPRKTSGRVRRCRANPRRIDRAAARYRTDRFPAWRRRHLSARLPGRAALVPVHPLSVGVLGDLEWEQVNALFADLTSGAVRRSRRRACPTRRSNRSRVRHADVRADPRGDSPGPGRRTGQRQYRCAHRRSPTRTSGCTAG